MQAAAVERSDCIQREDSLQKTQASNSQTACIGTHGFEMTAMAVIDDGRRPPQAMPRAGQCAQPLVVPAAFVGAAGAPRTLLVAVLAVLRLLRRIDSTQSTSKLAFTALLNGLLHKLILHWPPQELRASLNDLVVLSVGPILEAHAQIAVADAVVNLLHSGIVPGCALAHLHLACDTE